MQRGDVIILKIGYWRIVELALVGAILLVGWQHVGDHVRSYMSTMLETRSAQQALLPKGGLVAQGSGNPLRLLAYQWRNYRTTAPLLLPDITPVIGEDDPLNREYPNMEQWLIDTKTQSGRTLLRINTLTANVGEGPLHVVGGEITKDDKQVVYQRIWRADNTFIDQEAGHFVYHADHDHIHFDNYAQYVLRLQDAEGRIVATGRKIGFCLTDVIPIDRALTEAATIQIPLPKWACGTREQGINSGYSDYYGAKLTDQWIDITDVPFGEYQLQIVVDPNNLIKESNEENNRLSMPLLYTEETVEDRQFYKK